MMNNLSIKKKLLLHSILIQFIILTIFAFSLYKALEISTIDKLQATLKVITLDVTDDLLEHTKVAETTLDEDKEYNFEPLYIRILDSKTHKKIIETSNFPKYIEHNDEYLSDLKKDIITFQVLSDYFISRIKIDFHNQQELIIEVGTTKDILNSTLENLLYIVGFILPIVLLFSLLGSNFIIYKSFLPIEKIVYDLKNINATDLSKRLENSQNQDEIGMLSDEINSLLSRLDLSFQRISQFSSDASHELKTPLTIIRGELEIALRKDRNIDEYKNVLHSCFEEVTRIEQTIHDLLFLAKNEQDLKTEKFEDVYLDEVMEESINEINSYAILNNITIKCTNNEFIEFKGYSNLLKIAIKNLLKNAIQYSYKDGEVLVSSFRKDNLIQIYVQDFGIGIEKDKQEKIFEQFYRTDKSRNKNSGGTGLGMSIVKKIIDIHRGKVEIKSEENGENKGTTIVVSLFLD